MQTKKNVFLWALYDFANSLVSIVFFLYFAQWLVIDQGVADIWFNLTFTISAILLLISAPVTGVLLDKYLRRLTGLRYTTIATFVFYGACALFAVNGNALLATICFTLGLYAYIFSFTFYTPLIKDISKEGKSGLVSGLGVFANYLGSIVGLIIVLPLSKGSLNFFGGTARAETLLPSVILFFILALPMLIFFKEPIRPKPTRINGVFREAWDETKALFYHKSALFFLLAFFLFNDAVLTAANNFPIFVEKVWGVDDTIKTYIMLGILITSAIGGVIGGLAADKFGHKKTLVFILSGWIIILPALGFITNFTLFVITTTIMGIWYGSNWTVARSVMSHVSPKGKHNLSFAYYGVAERASSLIGPLVWGGIVTSMASFGPLRYRVAIIAISVFIIFGLIALLKVRDDRKIVKKEIKNHNFV